MEENTKVCCICRESKPLEDFYNLRKSKDGKASNCKACQIKMNAASKAKAESDKKQTEPIFVEFNKAWKESKALPGLTLDRSLASRIHQVIKRGLDNGNHHRALDIYMAAHNRNLTELDGLYYMQWLVQEAELISMTYGRGFTPEDHKELKACRIGWQRQYMEANRSIHCRA